MNRIVATASIALSVFSYEFCGGGTPSGCPSEAEAQAAFTKYVQQDYWSPSQRDVWKIKTVSPLTFGPMTTGKVTPKHVEYGQSAQNVCPIRMTYSFDTEDASGTKKTTTLGENKTHLFYKNPFNEWTFKDE